MKKQQVYVCQALWQAGSIGRVLIHSRRTPTVSGWSISFMGSI